ncbi:MAG TPA: ankyrin repeat domain-containing protein, partial [Vicinamibacterales bacterium]|nr:ankyrin repeat domain-containing protein [Vicinamibacterales bacterium]
MKRLALILAVVWFPAIASAQEVAAERLRVAAARALVSIQKAQAPWYTTNKQVCASCHHQYQPAVAYRVARDHGIPLDETIASADATKAFDFSDIDKAVQYTYVIEPAVDDAYRMVAANAAGVKRNLGTAIYARLLISRQNAQGDWDGFHQRPPSSYSRVTMAALGLRAVQVYHHASQKAQADAAVSRARTFLEKRTPRDTEERSYQLLGLRWAGAPRAMLQSLARDLKATQRPDGGWNSVNGRESDAYSTAQALVALYDGGGVAIIDASYQRGIQFLLKTQAADGTWHVTSRLHPPAPLSPPYFDAGYPNEHDQFLSMQGASWAVMALSYALEQTRPVEPPALPGTEPAGVEPWVETMIFGTRDEVRKLLDSGLSASVATKSGGTTALMMAAPDVEKMTLLLDRGADVNARANTRYSALMVAAQYQEADAAINLLLDRGAQVAPPATAPVFNANPFFLASYAGNAKSLKRLLGAGGKLDEAMIAIGTSRTTPMLGAFKFGDIEVARTLLDLGAPVDFADGNGITMLGRSALNNDLEMARML